MKLTRHHFKEMLIYTCLTFGGLLVDLATANGLVYLLSVPLMISGACGLLTGAITNYFIHLKVTFKHLALKTSWAVLFKYLQTCLIGAGIRLLTLAFLAIFTNFSSFLSLIMATIISFGANYLLSKFYVFKPSP